MSPNNHCLYVHGSKLQILIHLLLTLCFSLHLVNVNTSFHTLQCYAICVPANILITFLGMFSLHTRLCSCVLAVFDPAEILIRAREMLICTLIDHYLALS